MSHKPCCILIKTWYFHQYFREILEYQYSLKARWQPCKRKKPTVEILGHLFKRLPEKEDPVLPSLSLFWLRYSNTFPEVFATFLTRQEHLESKQERELLLKHTNLLLPSCHSIFCSASVQKGYKRLSVACSDEEKSRHADLFQAVFSFGKKTENGGERSRKRSVADIS